MLTVGGRNRGRAFALALIAGLAGCSRCGGRPTSQLARYDGGAVTAEDLHQEGLRLPPMLRARLATDAGRRDLASAIVDKRLLVREARRLELDEDPEIRRQVSELEERLIVQALLQREEKAAGPASAEELQAWYAAHKEELATPERVHLRRILIAVEPGATAAERERARVRAERLAARLRSGEKFEKVAADGDGPERGRGGDLGLIARGQGQDPLLEAVAFQLPENGRSQIQPVAGGLAIVEAVEKRPAQTPTLEQARGEIANRLDAQRKRKIFDALLERLRAEAHAAVATVGEPR